MNKATLDLIAETARARISNLIDQHGGAGEVAVHISQALKATAILVSGKADGEAAQTLARCIIEAFALLSTTSCYAGQLDELVDEATAILRDINAALNGGRAAKDQVEQLTDRLTAAR